jgi:hypothetical protein
VSPPGNPASELLDLRELASRIARTRNDFGRVYDEVRAAVPNTRPFITVSAGAGNDQVAFERALRQADEEGWFRQLSARLLHDDFFPDQSPVVTDLQALVRAALGFPDVSVVGRGFVRATERLCRVEVTKDGNPEAVTGTGFLVGPSTVLTAFHVIASLVDDQNGERKAKPGSQQQLRVRFDHVTGRKGTELRVPADWLVASKPPHPAEIATKQEIPEVVAPMGNVDLSGFLDYAVIVVAGSPGSERGYYDLERTVEPVVGGTVHLFQHPMGVQQRQASGEFTGFRNPPGKERINHSANALAGSSGGLLLDGNYALIGLHQGAHSEPVVNSGISAIAIRDHVLSQGANLLDQKYVQASRVVDGSRPILGRAKCQELVRRNSKPLVRVKPVAGLKGVSFTLEIMRACLPEKDHVIERVQVLEFDSDAMKTATMLLKKLGVDDVGLPTEVDASTSRGAWIGQLVATFGARVEETHRGRTVWLGIDDLQKDHAIPDGSVRDFLSELYRQSPTLENFRIMLLGLTDFPSGFPTGFVDDEDISPPQVEDLVSYVRIRLTKDGIDHSGAEVDRFAKLIAFSSKMDISSLSDFVADKVDRVLNTGTEAIS